MGKDQFERLLGFARRTGDRLIVTDPKGEEPIVIMNLEQYENLLTSAYGPSKSFSLPIEEDEADVPDFIPALEVMERIEQTPARDVRSQKIQEKPQEGGEEQFYLEPL